MARRQGFVTGSLNPNTNKTMTPSELNVAWNRLEVLKSSILDGTLFAMSDAANSTNEEICNLLEGYGVTLDPTKSDQLLKLIQALQASSLTFKGYVATAAPSAATYSLKSGDMWINSATLPTTFPVAASSLRVWNGSAWATTTAAYTPTDFDAWRNINDNQGYYWFGGQWTVMTTDLSANYFVLGGDGKWAIKNDVALPGLPTITGTLPATNSTTNQDIASLGWVNDPNRSTNVVHRSADENIGGTKAFSGSVRITGNVGATSSTTGQEVPTVGWVNDASRSTNVVHKTAQETITGSKTFTAGAIFKNTGIEWNVLPSSPVYGEPLTFVDNNGVACGWIDFQQQTDGRIILGLNARHGPSGQPWGGLTIFAGESEVYITGVTPSSNANDTRLATTEWVRGQVAANVPVGTILAYSGATPPTGFLACDGSSLSRTQYPDLNTLYRKSDGTYLYGSQNAQSFNLPNLNYYVPMYGAFYEIGHKQDGMVPNLTGTVGWHYTDTTNTTSGVFQAPTVASGTAIERANSKTGATTLVFNAGGQRAAYQDTDWVIPRSLNVMYIVKY